MLFGIGIDIVAISRFERFIADNNIALIERLFTPAEREYCSARKRSAQHFALRFAAKESYLKALGTGLRDGISWQDMEIVNDTNGKPHMQLSGMAKVQFDSNHLSRIFVSLSHDGDSAIASVVLEKP